MDTKIKSKAFQQFTEATNTIVNAAIREWKDQGGKVVGYVCSAVPVEIIEAAGLLPYRMRATGSTGTELSDAYFSNINCSFPRHCFNLALKGEFDFLDGLVCSNSCDHTRRIYDNWKRNVNTPFLGLISLPMKTGEPQVEWFINELQNFRSALSKHFDVDITDDRLREAIKQCNQTRQLTRQLYDLRKADNPPITGAEAIAVTVAATTIPRHRYNELLKELLEDLSQAEGNSEYDARLLVIGSILDDPAYVEVIEELGGLVVADALCFGSRPHWVDVDEEAKDPITALARHYVVDRPSCPRMFGDQPRRASYVKDMVREFNVDGIIGERMNFCDQWLCEFYMLDSDLKEVDVPMLNLEREYIFSGAGQLTTRVQAFLEAIGR